MRLQSPAGPPAPLSPAVRAGRPAHPGRRPSAVRAGDKGPGFRFDPYYNRWVRDDKYAGKVATTVSTVTGEDYTVWPLVYTELVDKYRLKTIPCEKAEQLTKKGYTLLDVSLPSEFAKRHAKGAVNASLFRKVEGDGFYDKLKKVSEFFLQTSVTERNTNFIEDATAVLPGKSKIIVMCNTGGTLDTVIRVGKKQSNDPDRAFGRESRSLKACYELFKAGFRDIYHLEGGYQQWVYEGFEYEGSR